MKTIKTKVLKTQSDHLLSAREMLEEDSRKFVSNTLNLPEGCTLFKLDSTKTRRIDLIPYIAGAGNPLKEKGETALFRSYYTHRDIGPDKEVILCPKMTYGKRCPVCEEVDRLRNIDWNDPVGKLLKWKHRQLWNVKDIDDRDADILVWDVPQWFFGEALTVADKSLDEGDPKRYYASLTAGYSLKLTVAESPFQSKNKNYTVERVDFFERKKQYKLEMKKKAWCLEDLIKPAMKYDALKELFLQTPSDGDEEDNNESDNSSRKNGSPMKRKSVTAKSKGIKVGSTVEHEDLEKCCVTSISKDGFTLTLDDEDGDEHEGIGVSEVALADEPKKVRGKASNSRPKTKTKTRKVVEEEEDSSDDDDEDETEDEDEDEPDDDDSELEDEDEPDDDDSELEDTDDDEDSEEDDEDDETEEEEEEPVPTKRVGRPKGKSKKH